MIINFTENHQFFTRLKLNNNNIDIVESMKILGTTINNKLEWSQNCTELVKKSKKTDGLCQKNSELWSK